MIWVVNFAANLAIVLILLRIAASWLDRGTANRYVRLLHVLTDPLLAPFRRLFRSRGMTFDFSPVLALIAIEALRWLIVAIL